MEKFAWKCVKAPFWKNTVLVYNTLHSQSRIRIGWKFSGTGKKVRIRPDPDPQPCLIVFRLLAMVRIFAYTEEFSCSPPTFIMIILTLLGQSALRTRTAALPAGRNFCHITPKIPPENILVIKIIKLHHHMVIFTLHSRSAGQNSDCKMAEISATLNKIMATDDFFG